MNENNKVTLCGEVISEPVYNHSVYGEDFYMLNLGVKRKSYTMDSVPLMISSRLFEVGSKCTGARLRVDGEFRSYNEHREDGNKLILAAFVKEVEELDDCQSDLELNEIMLDGYICKPPTYRKTPLGREIADVLLAVNRTSYGKSDYIPCISWGRNAFFMGDLEVGTHLQIHGRIQSRTYVKKLSEELSEERTAYEVSVSAVEVIDDDKEKND